MDLREGLGITAESFCVMERGTGEIVGEYNMGEKRPVASITKLMTAYTVLSLAEEFNVDVWETRVGVGREAAELGGTTAGLRMGDELSVYDLLHGMMLPSGNDAAVALAYYFGNMILMNDTGIRSSENHSPVLHTTNSKLTTKDKKYSYPI